MRKIEAAKSIIVIIRLVVVVMRIIMIIILVQSMKSVLHFQCIIARFSSLLAAGCLRASSVSKKGKGKRGKRGKRKKEKKAT